LDEATYQLLRKRAFELGIPMAALVRRALGEYLGAGPPQPKRLEDFQFIGSGYSERSGLEAISEQHDDALAEDFAR